MTDVLLIVISALLIVVVALQARLLLRKDDALSEQAAEVAEKSNERVERAVRDEIRTNREELSATLKAVGDTLNKQLVAQGQTNDEKLYRLQETIERQLRQIQADSAIAATQMREQVGKLTETNQQKLDAVRTAVEDKLKSLQEDNAKQLDQIRQTVDEKLQSTLEKRLGESFKQVSEQLEQVYKGLGEMQNLATGVGDLKKVLSNVKTRGIWGEIQLGALLEQALSPDQYAANVATKEGNERVEFAIKLPGRSDDKDEVVWLPIDAKFPIEDYQRLVDAQERADVGAAEAAAKQLESRVKACARDIRDKYLSPPKTTDFGILFLPTEGLFAEVMRRPGLAESLQQQYRVAVAGPTTLWSLLNGLRMGFSTLVIQKRSAEVWNLLAAVKTEWSTYGDILSKVKKKLNEATNTIDDAEKRTRVIGRKLKDLQQLPAEEARSVLMVPPIEDDEAVSLGLPFDDADEVVEQPPTTPEPT